MIRRFTSTITILLLSCFYTSSTDGLELQQPSSSATHGKNSFLTSRRRVFASLATSSAAAAASILQPAFVNADDDVTNYNFQERDRKGNAQALIREDYWFVMGKTPPRKLDAPLQGDDPKFNAFGSCESAVKGSASDGNNNPCTYVSLKQRIPAYTKYGSTILYGAKDMQKLGNLLRKVQQNPTDNALWEEAEYYVAAPGAGQLPPPLVDAELKMVLLATSLTTSPNFPLPSRELYVARYYANECHFSSMEMATAINSRDINRAIQAWDYGKDSWNSYFQVVNRSISSKVGDKFELIS